MFVWFEIHLMKIALSNIHIFLKTQKRYFRQKYLNTGLAFQTLSDRYMLSMGGEVSACMFPIQGEFLGNWHHELNPNAMWHTLGDGIKYCDQISKLLLQKIHSQKYDVKYNHRRHFFDIHNHILKHSDMHLVSNLGMTSGKLTNYAFLTIPLQAAITTSCKAMYAISNACSKKWVSWN